MARFIGILPAAGTGSRLQPFQYPKELLPVSFHWSEDGHAIVPKLAIEHSLSAMQTAAVDDCVIVISDTKPEILRYLGDGAILGVNLAYVVQAQPLGLSNAVNQACRWASRFSCNCCMALPDTIFAPIDAIKIVNEELITTQADLVLGVFPTSSPEELGPVQVAEDGTVKAVFDKPKRTELKNTWALAAWTPNFSHILHGMTAAADEYEVVLGEAFDLACKQGLNVRAVEFPTGTFHDLGTHAGLSVIIDYDSVGRAP